MSTAENLYHTQESSLKTAHIFVPPTILLINLCSSLNKKAIFFPRTLWLCVKQQDMGWLGQNKFIWGGAELTRDDGLSAAATVTMQTCWRSARDRTKKLHKTTEYKEGFMPHLKWNQWRILPCAIIPALCHHTPQKAIHHPSLLGFIWLYCNVSISYSSTLQLSNCPIYIHYFIEQM